MSEIESYCNLLLINDKEERAELVKKVILLDREYTNSVISERQKKASDQARKNKRRGPPGR